MKKLRNYIIGDYLSSLENDFDKSRIELLFNVLVFFFVSGVFYLGKLYSEGHINQFYVSLVGQGTILSGFIFLRFRKKYLALIGGLASHVLIEIMNFYWLEGRIVVTGVLFGITMSILAFLVLGKWPGVIITLLNTVMLVLRCIELISPKSIVFWTYNQTNQVRDEPIGILVPTSVLIYMLIVNHNIRKRTENRVIEQRGKLQDQNQELDRQKKQLEKQHNDIKASINYARRLQDAILPSFDEVNQHIPENFILFKPRDVVSGDFYWFEKVGDHLYLAAADCTGHGVPGAMVSVVCANALNRCVLEFGLTEPSEILDKTRTLVVETFAKRGEEVKDGMDISLIRFAEGSTTAAWAGANNPVYILRSQHQEVEIIKGNREPIGFTLHPEPFTQHEISLQKNDIIYLFTDGFADQFGGPQNKKIGYKRFREHLTKISSLPMQEQKNALLNHFNQWLDEGDDEQIDDVCVIGVKIR